MPNAILPVVGAGKFRRQTIQSLSSISLTTGAQAQTQVDIPVLGDIFALGFDVTVTATGTLSTPLTVNHALSEVSIKDKSGISIWQGIRGQDLGMLENFRNLGRARTVTVLTGGADNYYTIVPCNIEQGAQTARLQLTLNPYSSLATSGCTGATVSINVIAFYKDQSAMTYTERISRQTLSTANGRQRFASFLPQGSLITDMFFTVGTESYLTSIDFSENGAAELSTITRQDLIALDNDRLVGGHATYAFSLYNSPFRPNTTTVFDVIGSSADTMQLFLIEAR